MKPSDDETVNNVSDTRSDDKPKVVSNTDKPEIKKKSALYVEAPLSKMGFVGKLKSVEKKKRLTTKLNRSGMQMSKLSVKSKWVNYLG